MEDWAEHSEQLFNRPAPEPDEPREETLKHFSTVDAELPCSHEIELAVHKLNRNKIPGKDSIPADFLKHSGITVVEQLTTLVRKKTPKERKVAIIKPIFKPRNNSNCANYRDKESIRLESKQKM